MTSLCSTYVWQTLFLACHVVQLFFISSIREHVDVSAWMTRVPTQTHTSHVHLYASSLLLLFFFTCCAALAMTGRKEEGGGKATQGKARQGKALHRFSRSRVVGEDGRED